MKNVAPNARSFDRERPLTVAAIACSRIPKCRFLPPRLPAWKLPAPSYVSVVLFDGPRSAEPPRDVLRKHVEHLARSITAGDALGIRREDGEVAIPPHRQVSSLHLIDLGRELRMGGPIRREERGPLASSR